MDIEDESFLSRSKGSRVAGLGKMSSFAHFIADLCSAKLLIYHGTLSNNGEAILLFFKCMSEALGGHSLAWSAEKVILIEKRSAFHIFGYYSGKMCSRAGYFLSYTAYALAAGVKDPLMLEPYGKHKLIRYREPALLGSLEQGRSQSSPVSFKKKNSSSQVKGRVPIGRPWEKP